MTTATAKPLNQESGSDADRPADQPGRANKPEEGGLHTQPAPTPERPNILDPAAQRAIKGEVRKIWNRKRRLMKLTEQNLATALDLSQSSVNRLLNNDTMRYPWLPRYLKIFAEYTDTYIRDLAPVGADDLGDQLATYCDADPGDQGEFLKECILALQDHYKERGRYVPPDKLSSLAGKLANMLAGKRPTKEEMDAAIIDVIHRAAIEL